ncbi:MAG: hypothetical protein ACP5LI_07420, partial [Hydrogenobaculum sp.]
DISKTNEVYLAFNWKNTSMKYAFQTGNPVYVKIGIPYQNRELSFYIKCSVFSSVRDNELVLVAESLVEVPPFLKRTSVRVEFDSKHKAYAKLCLEDLDECFSNLSLKNISETGFAIKIEKDENKDHILDKIKDLAKKDNVFDVELYIDSDIVRGKASLVNIYEEEDELYAGFKMSVDRKDAIKLSSIIMKLQQEIIQEIKSL